MRKPRLQSSTDIYHVMIRGVNKRVIFEDEEDYNYFINILHIVKCKYTFELYAFCLMDNHVHLLIKASKTELSTIMKSIQIRYQHWMHDKYDYEGHLCGGRFKSVPVESQPYFQKLMHYIHNNPVKANICKTPGEYTKSSLSYYETNTNDLIDRDKGIYYFGVDDVKEVLDYINKNLDFGFTDFNERKYTYSEAIMKIKYIISLFKVNDFCELKDAVLKEALKQIKNAGISIAQLRKFTGLPFAPLKLQWQRA